MHKSLSSVSLFVFIFVPNNWNLFDLFTDLLSLKSEYHISVTLKKAYVMFPAHATFTVL